MPYRPRGALQPRWVEMITLRRRGVPLKDIAARFGIAVSTAHGTIQRAERHLANGLLTLPQDRETGD